MADKKKSAKKTAGKRPVKVTRRLEKQKRRKAFKEGQGQSARSEKPEGCSGESRRSRRRNCSSSKVVYQGPLFRVLHDKLIEPGGKHSERDVIRHNGSVVILAIDSSKSKKNPWIVIERQYRHAANQYLWELPAGKLDQAKMPWPGPSANWPKRLGTREEVEAAGGVLRQPRVSGRVDEGVSGGGLVAGECAS